MKVFIAVVALVAMFGLVQSADIESCFKELDAKLDFPVPDNLAAFQKFVSSSDASSRPELEEMLQEAAKKPELEGIVDTVDRTCNNHFGPQFEEAKLSTKCGKEIDMYMAIYSENADKRAQFLPKFPKIQQLNEAFEFCASVKSVSSILAFEPDADLSQFVPLYKRSFFASKQQ